jgi:hypothetical protein
MSEVYTFFRSFSWISFLSMSLKNNESKRGGAFESNASVYSILSKKPKWYINVLFLRSYR